MRAKRIALNPPPRVDSCFEGVFTSYVAQIERVHDDHDDHDDHDVHEDGDDDDDSPHALYNQSPPSPPPDFSTPTRKTEPCEPTCDQVF